MTQPVPPPVGGEWLTWARQMRAWLQTNLSRLTWWDSGSRAVNNGILLWDDANGYPVVSKSGEWVELALGDSAMDFRIRHAENEIFRLFSADVDTLATARSLSAQGRNVNLGTSHETVWGHGGDETYVSTNTIDTLSSSDATDTQSVLVIGHTVTGTGAASVFSRVSQVVVLAGQAKVPLATPIARVDQLQIAPPDGSPSGDVYVYEDTAIVGGVPTDATKVHDKLGAGIQRSYKAAVTVPDGEYLLLSSVLASINKATGSASFVDFEVGVRFPGGEFIDFPPINLATDAQTTGPVVFDPYPIIRANSDVRIRAISTKSPTDVSISLQGYFSAVQP